MTTVLSPTHCWCCCSGHPCIIRYYCCIPQRRDVVYNDHRTAAVLNYRYIVAIVLLQRPSHCFIQPAHCCNTPPLHSKTLWQDTNTSCPSKPCTLVPITQQSTDKDHEQKTTPLLARRRGRRGLDQRTCISYIVAVCRQNARFHPWQR